MRTATMDRGARVIVASILAVVLLALSAGQALACEIDVQPISTTPMAGEQQTVLVRVALTHRNCITPIEETKIVGQGVTVVAQSGWTVTSEGYEQRLTVAFPEAGPATLAVIRECSKGGDTAEVAFVVGPASSSPPTAPTLQTGAGPTPAPSSTPTTSPSPAPVTSPTPAPPAAAPAESGESSDRPSASASRGGGRGRRTVSASASAPLPPATATPTPAPTATPTASPTSALPTTASVGGGASPGQTTPRVGGDERPEASGLDGLASTLLPALLKSLRDPKTLGVTALLSVAAVAYVKKLRRVRQVVLLTSLGYLGFYLGGCLCPLGAIQKLALFESTASQRVAFLVTLGVPLVATIFFGRLYCGWVCPAGALQEVVHFRKVAVSVPLGIHRWLKLLKYALFVALIAAVRIAGEPVFEGLDPFKAAFERGGDLLLLAALAAVLGVSVFVYRPWCRYLCPMAAVFAVVAKLSPLRLVGTASCVACRLCARACKTQSLSVDRSARRVTVDNAECLSCGDCRGVCRKGALVVGTRSQSSQDLHNCSKVPSEGRAMLASDPAPLACGAKPRPPAWIGRVLWWLGRAAPSPRVAPPKGLRKTRLAEGQTVLAEEQAKLAASRGSRRS